MYIQHWLVKSMKYCGKVYKQKILKYVDSWYAQKNKRNSQTEKNMLFDKMHNI